ncbi:MAG: TonB-dependent receptor [Sphingobium sp.]|nr:TonB-dependent receptor [Sphingobium sp.]
MRHFHKDNHKRSLAALLATSAIASAAALSTPATAQNTTAASEASTPTEAIVITGSRIARKDYTATSPIVTVDSELLEKSAAINLEANLNKLPQFSPALSQFTTGDIQANANNTIGASTVSLRQLGSNRNLVLIDGRRPTPINGTGVVDINTIPSAAIERVEIISGGASSTYGADAVGGVVNFIMKKNFEGVNIDGQVSTTQRGDGTEYRMAFLVGANVAGGRGNVMMGAERYSRNIILRKDRPWFQATFRNPNISGTELFLAENYVSFLTGTGNVAGNNLTGPINVFAGPNQNCINAFFQGGVCGSATFAGKGAPRTATSAGGVVVPVNIPTTTSLYINPDQTLFATTTTFADSTGPNRTFVPLLYGYTGQIDGLARKKLATGVLADNNLDEILSSSQNRWTFFAKGRFDITEDISFVGQSTFARTQTPSLLLYASALGTFGTVIPHGSDIYHGNAALGIPDSVDQRTVVPNATGTAMIANPNFGKTAAEYLPGGKYGLNCPVMGGCTNSQAFPTPPELTALLDNRQVIVGSGTPTSPFTPYNGPITYAGKTYSSAVNTPFQVNVTPEQLGRRKTDNFTTTFQVLAGFEGRIPGTDFTWDITASHGETVAKSNQFGFVSGERWRAIMSAPNFGVNFSAISNGLPPGNGFNGTTASCKSGLNPFVERAWTSDCVKAVSVDTQNENRLQQDMVEANIQGGLVDLPYGQLRGAFGAAYRKNSIDFTPDSSVTDGGNFLDAVNGIFAQGHTKGSINVKEAYGELLIPVLSNLPFAKALNLEVGYRISDYSTIGSVGTYKINAEWAPVNWFRFRGGYQNASRAPNLGELFTAQTQIFFISGEGDPCSRGNTVAPAGFGNYSANTAAPIKNAAGVQTGGGNINGDGAKVEALCKQIMGTEGATQYYREGRTYPTAGGSVTGLLTGNTNLKQETAKTFTIGAVISSPFDSPWLRRLRLSVDYYNIQLSDGIAQQSPGVASRLCFSKNYNPNYEMTDPCKLVLRDQSTGEQGLVRITYSNLGRVETDGVDVQADWGVTFKDVGLPIPGAFSENIQFSYLNHFKTTTDSNVLPLIDYAGTLGPNSEVGTSGGSYRWRLLANFSYSVGPFRASLQWQHKPKIEQSAAATSTNNQTTGYKSYDLFSLSGTVTIMREAVVRFGVDNLFDKAPPLGNFNRGNNPALGQLPGSGYNSSQYDVIGRRFYMGASYKF